MLMGRSGHACPGCGSGTLATRHRALEPPLGITVVVGVCAHCGWMQASTSTWSAHTDHTKVPHPIPGLDQERIGACHSSGLHRTDVIAWRPSDREWRARVQGAFYHPSMNAYGTCDVCGGGRSTDARYRDTAPDAGMRPHVQVCQ